MVWWGLSIKTKRETRASLLGGPQRLSRLGDRSRPPPRVGMWWLQGSSCNPKASSGGGGFTSSSWCPSITAKTIKSLELICCSSRSVGMKLGSTGHYFIWYLVPTHSAHRDYSFLSLIQTQITKNPIEIKKWINPRWRTPYRVTPGQVGLNRAPGCVKLSGRVGLGGCRASWAGGWATARPHVGWR
jgi:hypothetical protein